MRSKRWVARRFDRPRGLALPLGLGQSRSRRAISSVGRASRLHREGRRFEPVIAHQFHAQAIRGIAEHETPDHGEGTHRQSGVACDDRSWSDKHMKYLIALTVVAIVSPLPAMAALPVGAPAPDFTTEAAMAGKAFSYALKNARQKGPVVLYFFPAAFTPGCNVEAHEFAVAIKQFRKLGANVLGVAGDDIAKLSKFSVEECQNKFPVGVATPAMNKAYATTAALANRSNRTSYLISPDGRIASVWSNPDYRGHVPNMLKALRDWRTRNP
jgi:thioredoxin-dependent peroxiredoxin